MIISSVPPTKDTTITSSTSQPTTSQVQPGKSSREINQKEVKSNKVVASADSNLIKREDFEFSNATAEPYSYDGNADVAGRLIKVTFDVKNTSNKSKAPAYIISYAIKDGQSREFEEAALTIGILDKSIKKQVSDNILPGSSNRVSLIFDVSQDAENFQLGIAAGFSGKEWLKIN